MDSKVLINQIELAYSPICNSNFYDLVSDPLMQENLKTSSLYFITHRPVLSFENITHSQSEGTFSFEIHQKNTTEILQVKLPIFQKNIAIYNDQDIFLKFVSNDPKTKLKSPPFRNVHELKIFEGDKFLIWFTPEKFIQNYWKGHIKAEISGNFRKLTEYNVLYVGEATKQKIWSRLTNHSTLQEILSLEDPLTYGQIPRDEIALLLFRFKDNLQIHSWDGNPSSKKEVIASLTGSNFPNSDTLFLDVEKALIKTLQPKYNRKKYSNYPKSKDGLYNYNFNSISYTFVDPISLIYKDLVIRGGINFLGGDTIIISDNKYFGLTKATIIT